MGDSGSGSLRRQGPAGLGAPHGSGWKRPQKPNPGTVAPAGRPRSPRATAEAGAARGLGAHKENGFHARLPSTREAPRQERVRTGCALTASSDPRGTGRRGGVRAAERDGREVGSRRQSAQTAPRRRPRARGPPGRARLGRLPPERRSRLGCRDGTRSPVVREEHLRPRRRSGEAGGRADSRGGATRPAAVQGHPALLLCEKQLPGVPVTPFCPLTSSRRRRNDARGRNFFSLQAPAIPLLASPGDGKRDTALTPTCECWQPPSDRFGGGEGESGATKSRLPARRHPRVPVPRLPAPQQEKTRRPARSG